MQKRSTYVNTHPEVAHRPLGINPAMRYLPNHALGSALASASTFHIEFGVLWEALTLALRGSRPAYSSGIHNIFPCWALLQVL